MCVCLCVCACACACVCVCVCVSLYVKVAGVLTGVLFLLSSKALTSKHVLRALFSLKEQLR